VCSRASTTRSRSSSEWPMAFATTPTSSSRSEMRSPELPDEPKKSRGLLRQGDDVKFAYVAAEKARAEWKVSELCRALRVSPSGYYSWRTREPSARAQKDIALRVMIRASFEQSRRTYGSPRVHRDLVEDGERVGRKRVIRLMQEEGLRARVRK